MSLIPKHSMTDKNRAAHQRNGRQSRVVVQFRFNKWEWGIDSHQMAGIMGT